MGSTWGSVIRSECSPNGLWSRVLAARLLLVLLLLPFIASGPAPAATEGHHVYLKPSEFLRETFPGGEAEKKVLWISGELKSQVEEVMGHQLGLLRVRYWVEGGRTAWILEEIGKVELITVGVVVEAGRIEALKILIYRESRGWEIRYPFFTNQFVSAGLEGRRDELDQNVEGISGATLSVRAVTRLARLALVLDRKVEKVEDARPIGVSANSDEVEISEKNGTSEKNGISKKDEISEKHGFFGQVGTTQRAERSRKPRPPAPAAVDGAAFAQYES
jgi:hypothetical protein